MVALVATKMGEITLGNILDRMHDADYVLIEWLEKGRSDLVQVKEAKVKYNDKLDEEVWNVHGNSRVDKIINVEIGGE